MINGGLLIIEPSLQTYNELLELANTPVPSQWSYSEQELLTTYYLFQRPHRTTLLGYKTSLPIHTVDEIVEKHDYGNPNVKTELMETFDSVHFVCGEKPWSMITENEHFLKFIDIWKSNCRAVSEKYNITEKC